MKIFSDAALAALEAGTAMAHGAVDIECTPAMRVWGGYGQITLPDGHAYDGIGDRGLVSVSGKALGGTEQAVTLTLSGVEPDVLAMLDASAARRAPVVLWRLIFDGAGLNLLDAQIYMEGRLDHLAIKDTIGGSATIEAMVEGAARGAGNAGGRMRSDPDQRLISATDGGFKHVTYAGQKMLYWGGKPAAMSTTLQQAQATLISAYGSA